MRTLHLGGGVGDAASLSTGLRIYIHADHWICAAGSVADTHVTAGESSGYGLTLQPKILGQ